MKNQDLNNRDAEEKKNQPSMENGKEKSDNGSGASRPKEKRTAIKVTGKAVKKGSGTDNTEDKPIKISIVEAPAKPRKIKSEEKNSRTSSKRADEEQKNKKKKKISGGRVAGNIAIFTGKSILATFDAIGKVVFSCLSVVINVVLTLLLVLAITGVIVGCAFAVYLGTYVDASVEEYDIISNDQDQTTVIYRYDENGNPVELMGGKLYGSENRVYVDYEDVPQNLINAFIAIEDKRFEEHNGVDWKRTIRAAMYFVVGKADSGGSTLTQQLIKNVTKNDDNTIQRKVEEIFCALNLEKIKSKEEILEMYMNTVYFSQGCYGVQAAAYRYFNKPVSELTLVECCAIAGIVQNPYKIDPILHPENNKERRNNILYQMLDQGKITQLEYDIAVNTELVIYEEEDEDITAPETGESGDGIEEDLKENVTSWYVDAVIDDAIALFMEKYNVTEIAATQMVYTGGFKIYVAMDEKVQTIMESIYEDDDLINEIVGAKSSLVMPKSAMVVLDPITGNILGLVGDRGVKTQSRLFNYATDAKRQPGSSIKPLSVYSLALEKNIINYSTVYDDVPYSFNKSVTASGSISYSPWPSNSPNQYRGLTAINDAIARSVNTIAIRVVDEVGVKSSFDFLTKTLGMTTLVENEVKNNIVMSDINLSAMGIGGMTYGVTVKEITAGYTMFTNDGVYTEPRTILEICDQDDKVVIDNQPQTNVALSIENAAIMRKMLENVTQSSSGTGVGTKIAEFVDTAGKTGTTNKNYDKWFIGFTPYYIGGVWFGYENPQTLSGFSGNPSLKIWDYVMCALHEDILKRVEAGEEELKTFELPNSVVEIQYCRDSGLIATDLCKIDMRGSRVKTGYYTVDNMPKDFCKTHVEVKYCSAGGVACEYCPAETVSTVSLIKVTDRAFPKQIVVTDSQYVYRDITVGNVVANKKNLPFFYNELEEGVYVGITSSTGSTQVNRYCPEHYKGQPYGQTFDPIEPPAIVALLPDLELKIREEKARRA